MDPKPPLPPIPTALQRLLRAAQADPSLLERLVAGRSAFAAQIGHVLNPREASMLDAIPAAQLREMVASLPPFADDPDVASRPVHDFPAPGGCAHDEPPERPEIREMELEGGCAPDEPPERPDAPMTTRCGGIAPDLPAARSWHDRLRKLFGGK